MANSLDDLFEEAPDVLQYFLSLPPGRFTTVRGTLTKRIIKREAPAVNPVELPFLQGQFQTMPSLKHEAEHVL